MASGVALPGHVLPGRLRAQSDPGLEQLVLVGEPQRMGLALHVGQVVVAGVSEVRGQEGVEVLVCQEGSVVVQGVPYVPWLWGVVELGPQTPPSSPLPCAWRGWGVVYNIGVWINSPRTIDNNCCTRPILHQLFCFNSVSSCARDESDSLLWFIPSVTGWGVPVVAPC